MAEPVNIVMNVKILATGVEALVPRLEVPAGCGVFIRAHNGTAPGNSAPVYVGRPGDAVTGPRRVLAPNTSIPYPVTHTGEIAFSGNVGDGLEVSIVR